MLPQTEIKHRKKKKETYRSLNTDTTTWSKPSTEKPAQMQVKKKVGSFQFHQKNSTFLFSILLFSETKQSPVKEAMKRKKLYPAMGFCHRLCYSWFALFLSEEPIAQRQRQRQEWRLKPGVFLGFCGCGYIMYGKILCWGPFSNMVKS